MAEGRCCGLDGVPLELHARCWRCGLLFGPHHEERAGDPARLGLCRSCSRGLLRWASGGADLRLVEVDDPLAERWYTTTQAAPLLKRTPSTVRKMARNGALRSKTAPRPPGSTDRRGIRYLVLVSPPAPGDQDDE